MENGKQPINPSDGYIESHEKYGLTQVGDGDYVRFHGLTKREYFAGLAMQGLLSNDEHIKEEKSYPDITADLAIQYADALLKALEEQ